MKGHRKSAILLAVAVTGCSTTSKTDQGTEGSMTDQGTEGISDAALDRAQDDVTVDGTLSDAGLDGNGLLGPMVLFHAMATKSMPGKGPGLVADGEATSMWNAGAFAPQSLLLDLGYPKLLKTVRLLTAQDQVGDTEHQVRAGLDPDSLQLVASHSGHTASNQWLVSPLASPGPYRYLQVATQASPSYVAWREVEVESAPICGNQQCDVGETCSSCPGDCGGCPPTSKYGWDANLTQRCVKSRDPAEKNYYEDLSGCNPSSDRYWMVAVQSEQEQGSAACGPLAQTLPINDWHNNNPASPLTISWIPHRDEQRRANWRVRLGTRFDKDHPHPCGKNHWTWYVLYDKNTYLLPDPGRLVVSATVAFSDSAPMDVGTEGSTRALLVVQGFWDGLAHSIVINFARSSSLPPKCLLSFDPETKDAIHGYSPEICANAPYPEVRGYLALKSAVGEVVDEIVNLDGELMAIDRVSHHPPVYVQSGQEKGLAVDFSSIFASLIKAGLLEGPVTKKPNGEHAWVVSKIMIGTEVKNAQDYATGNPGALWSNLDVTNLLFDSKTN